MRMVQQVPFPPATAISVTKPWLCIVLPEAEASDPEGVCSTRLGSSQVPLKVTGALGAPARGHRTCKNWIPSELLEAEQPWWRVTAWQTKHPWWRVTAWPSPSARGATTSGSARAVTQLLLF